MEEVINPDIIESGQTRFSVALLAGGAAGTSVDVALFPLDTVKTRLQSEAGFWKSGGFRGIYSGLLSAALGSAPTAALFFVSYEMTKKTLRSMSHDQRYEALRHMTAASVGEISACLIRVPVEVVKQRTQALNTGSSVKTFSRTLQSEGFTGFYRGYFSTVLREVPFSAIQFPLWEFLKSRWSQQSGQSITAWQSSVCGACSGGFAAAMTTPLDVAKTRIMLAEKGSALSRGSVGHALGHVMRERGVQGLFAGMLPRTIWISIGGAIFLGVYEKMRIVLSSVF